MAKDKAHSEDNDVIYENILLLSQTIAGVC